MASLIEIANADQFQQLIDAKCLTVIHFYAEFAPQCSQINDVLLELAKDKELQSVKFSKIAAESLPDISTKYGIDSVPTCILFSSGKPLDTIKGADVPLLTKKVRQNAFKVSPLSSSPAVNSAEQDLNARLKTLINKAPVMVFMKGSPDTPRCGFSRTLVSIFKDVNCQFGHFDILQDEDVRQGLKIFSNWPTYPQVYVNGKLIGGLDIIKELQELGELEQTLKP